MINRKRFAKIKHKQYGAAMVEFAIASIVFFMVLFMVIELGRLMFAWNTLSEATRRGARVATVCPINHNYIRQSAAFGTLATGATDSPILSGLTPANIRIRYFNSDAITVSTVPTNPIHYRFVEVSIQNYVHSFNVPIIGTLINQPTQFAFFVRLPMESRGNLQNTGAGSPNHC